MARILVVDDNRMLRVLLTEILRQAGHTVFEAEDGTAGLAQFKARHPDLVVTDFYMPNMDGSEFVRAIRAEHGARSATPIIGLAGTRNSEAMLKEAGVDVYLPKPLREMQLLEAVQQCLDKIAQRTVLNDT